MEQINLLVQETDFLLGKQKEVKDFFQKEYVVIYDLLTKEQEKAEQVKKAEAVASCQRIRDLLKEQENDVVKELDDDIEFLQEQLKALTQVKDLGDSEKAKELSKLILDEEKPVTDFETFQKEVEEEMVEAQKSFSSMIEDISAAIQEGGITELEAFLEAQLAEDDHDDDEECDDDCSSCDDDCSSCCGGTDIFEGLEEKSDDEDDKPEDA